MNEVCIMLVLISLVLILGVCGGILRMWLFDDMVRNNMAEYEDIEDDESDQEI